MVNTGTVSFSSREIHAELYKTTSSLMSPAQQISQLKHEVKKMLIKISALERELAGGSDSSILKPHVKRVVQKRREFLKSRKQ